MEQKERKLRPVTNEDIERILNSYNLAECSGSGCGSGCGSSYEVFCETQNFGNLK